MIQAGPRFRKRGHPYSRLASTSELKSPGILPRNVSSRNGKKRNQGPSISSRHSQVIEDLATIFFFSLPQANFRINIVPSLLLIAVASAETEREYSSFFGPGAIRQGTVTTTHLNSLSHRPQGRADADLALEITPRVNTVKYWTLCIDCGGLEWPGVRTRYFLRLLEDDSY